MKFRTTIGLALLAAMLLMYASPTFARTIEPKTGNSSGDKSTSSKKAGKSNNKEKPYAELVKDKVKIEGLFTFFMDTTDNSVLMEVKPEHFGPYYLCNMARATSDGSYYDTGPPGNSFPFYLKRVGKTILFLEKNLRVRADTTSTMHDAVAEGISDFLFGSLDIKSAPDDSTKGVLVDPTSLFVQDAENTSYYLGQRRKTGVRFDAKNSYIEQVKSFPLNSEIDAKLYFSAGQPISGLTLQNNNGFFHRYHYSFSAIPESDYVPRLADTRVGNFVTMYLDYSELDRESQYVRFVERWNLKKKNPEARISEPVKPIVYWIENTVPVEYRDAVAEGIEFWNQSFERIGFRNAIVAKQMPDTASWDPLDIRYSVFRWIYSPGVYAIGPSRANPFTGEIYDADISISSDFVRYMFINMENYIGPVSFDGTTMDKPEIFNPGENRGDKFCNYASELAEVAAFGMAYLYSSIGDMADKDSLTKEYVHAYLVEVVAHEVGHTLGFRHNFKASTIHSLEQINDREFTRQNSTIGTVMDYAPPNIAGNGNTQGEFYSSTPGPYDNWIIEFSYSDFGAKTPEEEKDKLNAIASRSAEPDLVYCSDYDMGANSVDPMANYFDLGSDPLRYCYHKVNLTRELWLNYIKEFEKPGVDYAKIRRVFQTGWRSYIEGCRFAVGYVGGLYHNTNFIGDEGGSIPFQPVPASEQRRAVKFLSEKVFAADAFDVPADLLNKLQQERAVDFMGAIYRSPIDYPWHQSLMAIQNYALTGLYSPGTLGRLLNNSDRYKPGEDRYSMYNFFTDIRQAIWGELDGPSNVNSHRRQLQLAHLNKLINIYLSGTSVFPTDARTLAANDLEILRTAASRAANNSTLNGMSRAHYREVVRQIDAAKNAQREFYKF